MSNDYEIVRISTYGEEEENPTVQDNNIRYPEIVQYVTDEEAVFAVNLKNRRFCLLSDFWQKHDNVKGFTTYE